MMRVRLHLGSLVAALAAGLPAGALADTELEAVEVEALMDAGAEQRYAAGRKVVFDREDIASLGRHGLIAELPLRQRAEQAMGGYIGDLARLRTSLDIACRMLATR